MANKASYVLHVRGTKESVEKFIKIMQWKDEYEHNGVPGVMSCYEDSLIEDDSGICTCYCSGSCLYSIYCSMRDRSKDNNIDNLSERLHLEIEAYASEYLACFEEYVYIKYGVVEADDCAKVCDLLLEEDDEYKLTDEMFDNSVLKEEGITKDNYLQYASEHSERYQNGWLHVGGFGKWIFNHVK